MPELQACPGVRLLLPCTSAAPEAGALRVWGDNSPTPGYGVTAMPHSGHPQAAVRASDTQDVTAG